MEWWFLIPPPRVRRVLQAALRDRALHESEEGFSHTVVEGSPTRRSDGAGCQWAEFHGDGGRRTHRVAQIPTVFAFTGNLFPM